MNGKQNGFCGAYNKGYFIYQEVKGGWQPDERLLHLQKIESKKRKNLFTGRLKNLMRF